MQPETYRLRHVAFVGNYVPRQCGIATFTSDLCEHIAREFKSTNCAAIAVNDIPEGYEYPSRVRFELDQDDIASYKRAAEFLNISGIDLVSLQHEFGIYGGKYGSHILAFLRELCMPVVTTLHTVLDDPDEDQSAIMAEMSELSDRIVVMSERGVDFLRNIYRIPKEKIDLIPHGIPDVPFLDPAYSKDRFGVEGKFVILTFGLLSSGKGIETVIEALPSVIKRYPNVVYIVLGATHPNTIRYEGEAYRESLIALARERGVADNVILENRFVCLEELVEYIGAADIYVTPYLNQKQIVSGTLAYAVGMGKPVISTPYWHAEELLRDGRGLIVPFKDAQATSEAILNLLDNEAERHAIRKRGYLLGRGMTWPSIAHLYMKSYERARKERTQHRHSLFITDMLDKRTDERTPLKLDHVKLMTDDTGMLQHAVFTVPDYVQGYTTDDNARALLAMVFHEDSGEAETQDTHQLATRYMAFLWNAINPDNGRFRNFMSYDRRWLEDVGSHDSHGRAMWVLGAVLGRSKHPGLRGLASRLFNQALPPITSFTSPRSWAFILIGLHEYLRKFNGDRTVQSLRKELAGRLMDCYRKYSSSDWPWFENKLTYCNAVLPHAMLLCGKWIPDHEMLEVGLRSLEWLAATQTSEYGYFVPIGSNGFYTRGEPRANFDQQPVEAQAMISACLEAYRVTENERWCYEAQRAFDWFLGDNDLQLPLYDYASGGCRDGLHPDRVNLNEGAESTLSFVLSLLEMRLSQQQTGTDNGKQSIRKRSPNIISTVCAQSIIDG